MKFKRTQVALPIPISVFHAETWLKELRTKGFYFQVLGIAGRPETMKIHYTFPPAYHEWVEAVFDPLLKANRQHFITALTEEGRQRREAQIAAGEWTSDNQNAA